MCFFMVGGLVLFSSVMLQTVTVICFGLLRVLSETCSKCCGLLRVLSETCSKCYGLLRRSPARVDP